MTTRSFLALIMLGSTLLIRSMENNAVKSAIVPALYTHPDEIDFILEAQPSHFNLGEKDCITQYTFRELVEKKARKGLPFIFCRAVTHSKDYRQSFSHNMSADILKHIYGPDFPNEIRPLEQAALNPINRCPFDNPIDILVVNYNPEDQSFSIEKLGTDLMIVRGNARLVNIINVANNTLLHHVGSKEYARIAKELSEDKNRCIARHGDFMAALHFFAKAERTIREKHENAMINAFKRLLCVAKNKMDNYFAAHRAMHLLYTTTQEKKYKKIISENSWIKNAAQEFLKYMTTQSHDLLTQDRALIEEARRIEDIDPEKSKEIYQKVQKTLRTPTKKAYAQAKNAEFNDRQSLEQRIKDTEEALAISIKHLDSPYTHRRTAAQRTITIAEPLLAALQVEKREQENQPTTSQPKKPVQRKLF